MKRKGFAVYMTVLAAICMITACNGKKVYDKYAHTPIAGWEKNDVISFEIPKITSAGIYIPKVGMRINNSYPFTSVTLIVEQKVTPHNVLRKDTLKCLLTDEAGRYKGDGINYYQYCFDLPEISLNKGDSVNVTIKHDMKREILPGISNVGISLSAR